MNLTKTNLKRFERAIERAGRLANEHGDACVFAAKIFDETFGQEVGEEPRFLQEGTNYERAFALFNNYTSYGENMSEGSTAKDLVNAIVKLMTEKEN